MEVAYSPINISLSPESNPAGDLIFDDSRHQLKIRVSESSNPINSCAYLEFSSRETLYDFALSLLWHSLYSKYTNNICYDREILYYPHIVDGMRLTEDSSRLFIHAYDKLPD